MKRITTTGKSSVALVAALAVAGCGCKSQKAPSQSPSQSPTEGSPVEYVELPVASKPVAGVMPSAVIYRMNGDYAQYVPINVSPDGSVVVSYPAPSDLTEESEPLLMADGYYLDRRGIGLNSRFTRYTYAQYRALKQAPTPDQLLRDIIPDARVIDVTRLPMTLTTALSDTAAVNAYIARLPHID